MTWTEHCSSSDSWYLLGNSSDYEGSMAVAPVSDSAEWTYMLFVVSG